jgi:hypothetical protein
MNSSVAVQRMCACGELAAIRLDDKDVCSTCAISYLPSTRPVSGSSAKAQASGDNDLLVGPPDSTKPVCYQCGAPAITVGRYGHICQEHMSNRKKSRSR